MALTQELFRRIVQDTPYPGLKARHNKAQVGNPGGPQVRSGWRPGLSVRNWRAGWKSARKPNL